MIEHWENLRDLIHFSNKLIKDQGKYLYFLHLTSLCILLKLNFHIFEHKHVTFTSIIIDKVAYQFSNIIINIQMNERKWKWDETSLFIEKWNPHNLLNLTMLWKRLHIQFWIVQYILIRFFSILNIQRIQTQISNRFSLIKFPIIL